MQNLQKKPAQNFHLCTKNLQFGWAHEKKNINTIFTYFYTFNYQKELRRKTSHKQCWVPGWFVLFFFF